MAIGKPIRPDGHFALLSDHFALLSDHFALLSDHGDRDALENRPSQVSCKHFVVPSTMSPHAHLARSPVGLAEKVWLAMNGATRDERGHPLPAQTMNGATHFRHKGIMGGDLRPYFLESVEWPTTNLAWT